MKILVKFIFDFFGAYYILFLFSFISIYYLPPAAPVLNVFILGFSYFLIIVRKRIDVIIVLMLYCRCMNGFIFMHNKLVYDVINLLNNLVPVILYFAAVLYQRRIPVSEQLVKGKFTFTILFFLFLTFSFLLNYSTSSDLLTRRYLPFLFFVLFLFLYHRPEDFSAGGIIRFFRSAFVGSLVVYFLPGYLEHTRDLIHSDSVFSVASPPNSYSLEYFSFTRNMGFIWDHRILAIFSYLYLLLAVVFRPRYYKLDVLISGLTVLTSTSRGGMITFALILFAYLFVQYRYKFLMICSGILISIVLFFVFESYLVSPSTSLFIRSFSPASENNALNQRKSFSSYALESFREKPVTGHGVGHLSSHVIDRKLVIDGTPVRAVSDAYWYVLLAEMGIIGLLLYLLFLFEVFYSQSILNIALLVGFVIQLLGTDIPDMRFFYFAFLVLVFIANNELKRRVVARKYLLT